MVTRCRASLYRSLKWFDRQTCSPLQKTTTGPRHVTSNMRDVAASDQYLAQAYTNCSFWALGKKVLKSALYR